MSKKHIFNDELTARAFLEEYGFRIDGSLTIFKPQEHEISDMEYEAIDVLVEGFDYYFLDD